MVRISLVSLIHFHYLSLSSIFHLSCISYFSHLFFPQYFTKSFLRLSYSFSLFQYFFYISSSLVSPISLTYFFSIFHELIPALIPSPLLQHFFYRFLSCISYLLFLLLTSSHLFPEPSSDLSGFQGCYGDTDSLRNYLHDHR